MALATLNVACPYAADVNTLGLAPIATAKAGRASIAVCQRWSSEYAGRSIGSSRQRFTIEPSAMSRIAELATVILADVRNAQLLQTEDDLFDVSRCLAAEQSDHVILPVFGSAGERIFTCLLAVTDRAAYTRWRPSRFWC